MVAWRFVDYFPHRVICVACVCTPYMPPAKPGVPFTPTEELVRTKLPNFGYQLFFAREDSNVKIEEALEQFLTTNFSPSVRALASEGGKPMPQFPVKVGEMESRMDGIIEAKRRGESRPVPTDPVRRARLDTSNGEVLTRLDRRSTTTTSARSASTDCTTRSTGTERARSTTSRNKRRESVRFPLTFPP